MTYKKNQPKYEDYKKMICQRAFIFSVAYNVPFDELVDEGNCLFAEALKKYDARRANFSTFLWRVLNTRLSDFCTRWWLQIPLYEEIVTNVATMQPTIQHEIQISEQLQQLSNVAKMLTDTVLSGPCEILGIPPESTPKKVRGALAQWLHDVKKQPWPIIWDAMREVKTMVAGL